MKQLVKKEVREVYMLEKRLNNFRDRRDNNFNVRQSCEYFISYTCFGHQGLELKSICFLDPNKNFLRTVTGSERRVMTLGALLFLSHST